MPAEAPPAASGRPGPADLRLRLQRLWKGTLLVGVAGAYVLFLAWTLIAFGWRPALLAVFLLALGQAFRHIASDIDRVGWTLAGRADGDTHAAKRSQARLFRLLVLLAQLTNVALAAQAYLLGGAPWLAAVVAGIVTVEALFAGVRRVNRRTAFEEASYGFRDRSLLKGPEDIAASREARAARVEERLERLAGLVREGKISERAYERACDRYRVRAVMAEPR